VQTAQPGERWTLWVKRTTAGGYGKLKGVDPGEDVHDLTARWVGDKKLDMDPSLVTLRLVKRGPGKPDAAEEEQAALLEPRQTLREAGIVDGSSLLAAVVSTRAGACVQRKQRAHAHATGGGGRTRALRGMLARSWLRVCTLFDTPAGYRVVVRKHLSRRVT
jgi:hypothetical protein